YSCISGKRRLSRAARSGAILDSRSGGHFRALPRRAAASAGLGEHYACRRVERRDRGLSGRTTRSVPRSNASGNYLLPCGGDCGKEPVSEPGYWCTSAASGGGLGTTPGSALGVIGV